MPITSARKIIQVGGSKSISLPPSWLDAAGIKLGDKVTLVAGDVVLIVPSGTKVHAKQLNGLAEIANRRTAK